MRAMQWPSWSLKYKVKSKQTWFTSPNCKCDVMHNPLPTAIEKHPNSRHVEIIIWHDFISSISANHTALFSRDSPAIGELTRSLAKKRFYTRGKNTRFKNGRLAAAIRSSWNFADLAGQAFGGYASYPPLMQVSRSHGSVFVFLKKIYQKQKSHGFGLNFQVFWGKNLKQVSRFWIRGWQVCKTFRVFFSDLHFVILKETFNN